MSTVDGAVEEPLGWEQKGPSGLGTTCCFTTLGYLHNSMYLDSYHRAKLQRNTNLVRSFDMLVIR